MLILNKNKTGLVFGAIFGLCHAIWAILVLIGLAQTFINWIFGLHFIQLSYTISEFRLGTAILLVVVNAVFGYIFGWTMAWIWNRLHQ